MTTNTVDRESRVRVQTMPKPVSTPAKNGRNTLIWYTLAIVCLPILGLLASLPIARSSRMMNANLDLANVGYGLQLQNADCDVLIYGDSSALTGVDPAIIQQKTGLPACNLAEFFGVTMINGLTILDRYFEKNPPPKYLIFIWAPEDLNSGKPWGVASRYEGIVEYVRLHSPLEDLRFLAAHPEDAFNFATTTLHNVLLERRPHVKDDSELHVRNYHKGFFPMAGFGVMKTCDPLDVRQIEPNAEYLRALRAHYQYPGMHVFVDVVPVPNCEPTYDYYLTKLSGLVDNKFERWPVDMFAPIGRLHFTVPGAEQLSSEIAGQITQQITPLIGSKSASVRQ